jgi:hypothetical protein
MAINAGHHTDDFRIVNGPLPVLFRWIAGSTGNRNNIAMKKKPSDRFDARHEFRCTKKELQDFREAAEREGFGGNVSAWLLWHLRKIVRESQQGFDTDDTASA